jgi:hypothetical membrane protein
MKSDSLVRVLSTLAAIGAALFLVVVIVLHGLSPEFSPVTQFISEYALGSYGALASVSFFVRGLSWILLGVSLSLGISRPGLSIVGLVLLFVSGVDGLLFGIFPVDPDPQMPTTLAGAIHFWAGMVDFIVGGLFPLLLALRFKNDERTKAIYKPALGLGIAVLIVDVVGFVLSGAGLALVGLTQRLFVALVAAWILLTTLRLASTATKPGSA